MLKIVLDQLGFHVAVAHDGPSGLALAKQFHPHVALLDIGLPVMDGYELASRLRKQNTLGGIRLIAITGYGQEEDKRRTAAAGFDLHLVKPIDVPGLVRAIEALDSRESVASPRSG
jgi:CheY-like chemotaxis protein